MELAPHSAMCVPETLIGLNFGTCRAQNSTMSPVIFSDASGGKIHIPRAMYSFSTSFWTVPRSCSIGTPCFSAAAIYMAMMMAAVALMVKDVLTFAIGMPS